MSLSNYIISQISYIILKHKHKLLIELFNFLPTKISSLKTSGGSAADMKLKSRHSNHNVNPANYTDLVLLTR